MVTPAEGVAVLAAAAMAALLARTTVLTTRTVLAAGPWTVTAALAVVAAEAGAYDDFAFEATPLLITATIAAVAALSWAGCAEIATLRDVPYQDRYLATTGGTAGLLLGVILLLDVGLQLQQLVWLVIAPIAAGLLAALGYFVLGLIYTDALTELRLAGLYTFGVVVFDGTASAIVVDRLGGTETAILTTGLRWLADAAGLDASVWTLLPVHLAIGLVFVAGCGWVSRKHREGGLLCALVGTTTVLWATTVLLLSAVLLG